MPYIPALDTTGMPVERRADLESAIVELQRCLREGPHADPEAIGGDLHYTFTRLLEVIPVVRHGRWRYRLCEMVEGLLGCCGKEFYRRLTGPYEDQAIERNGDVPLYDADENVRQET